MTEEGENYTVLTLLETNISLSISLQKYQYDSNEPINITANFYYGDAIASTAINAKLQKPDNTSENILLYDDGLHYDNLTNDGIYANSYTNTSLSGVYLITISANGTKENESFDRQVFTAVWIEQYPDLTINSSDIYFSNNVPLHGEKITINATIHNIGDADANNTSILFYDGEPANGTLIAEDIINVGAGQTAKASISWNATAGQHEIYVLISPFNEFLEKDYTNNNASKIIPAIQNLKVSRVTNTSASINWTTNEASRSMVKYGTASGNYQLNLTNSSFATSHRFELTGMAQGTKYYFKANSTDTSGNSAETIEYNFTTASSFIERIITTIGNRTNVTSGSGNTTLNITTNNSVVNAPINITEHAANPVSNNSIVRSGSIVSAPSINKFIEIEASNELKSNLSVITIRVNYSGSDLTGIDESSLRLYWWNESSSVWDALADSGVDATNKIVWGNVTHLSLFGVFDSSSDDGGGSGSSSSGGGGGGGGGGVSGENASNILVKEKYDLHIFKDKATAYMFTNSSNPIRFVNITGNTSAGEINVAVEVLKGTSTLVNVSPPGVVYKNVNIWVGTLGFAVPLNIKKATVEFGVDKNWIAENNIKSITLLRYDTTKKEWVSLLTSRIRENTTEDYYQGETDRFSPFVISGEKTPVAASATPAQTAPAPAVAKETPDSTEPQVKHENTIVSILSSLLFLSLPTSDKVPSWKFTVILLVIVGMLSIILLIKMRKNKR